jgi:peptidyl-prolyl cis-trans isomerase SurA
MRSVIPAVVATTLLMGGTIVDRIAVVVGRTAIKTSDIERDLRVTQFLNGQPADSSVEQRRAAAQRLIDQALIRRDLMQAGSSSVLPEDAKEVVAQLRRERFHGSEAQLKSELGKRGLTPAQLTEYMQWQMTVLRFIDERFRPGVLITEDDIAKYRQAHAEELGREFSAAADSQAAQVARVREILEGEQINRNFEEWLEQTRKSARIEYKLDELK